MSPELTSYFFEFIGTFMLVLLGDGVVANVVLKGTKGNSSGWVVITLAWGLAVFVGAYIAFPSDAHLNPAVTVGLAAAGSFSWNLVFGYIVAQILGGIVGAIFVYLSYKKHFDEEPDPGKKLAVFATGPAIRSYGWNCVTEIIGTFVLVFGILMVGGSMIAGPLPVALVVMVIGMSLGGATGYAINPARDLGPRIAHALLPIKDKGSSDWAYSWVPIVGPIIGGFLGAGLYLVLPL